jgi:hypothetical protein
MTITTNGHRAADTLGDDVQMCVRAPESGPETADLAGSAQESACTPVTHTRVIPAKITDIKNDTASKIRDFASLHGGDVKRAVANNSTLHEQPMTVAEAWRQLTPAAGEVGGRATWTAATVAGLFRACVLTVLYAAALSVGTRIRAGVAFSLCLLVLSTAGIVSALT